MKKVMIIPFGICLFLIVLSGLFLYWKYRVQVEARKELMVRYVSETKMKINTIALNVRELPYIVKPIIGENGMVDAEVDRKYREEIALLEEFYIRNDYFIRGISVHDRHGDVLSIYRDKKSGEFIHDLYKPRSMSIPRSEPGLVLENSFFSIVNPVYKGNVLAANVSVSLEIEPLQLELFKFCLENDNIWATCIFNQEFTQTFPLEEELVLSHERNISWGVWERKSGFVQGRIKGHETSAHVVTYYESLMIPEHPLGIAFSYNISPLIVSSFITYAVFIIILVAITFAVSFVMNRMMNQFSDSLNEKNQEIRLLQLIFSCAPAGIIVNRNNTLFAANNLFFTTFDGYLSLSDIGKEMEDLNFPPSFHHQREQEFEGWDIYKFERNGKEICLGRRQMNFDLAPNRFIIDTFWDVTEMEHRLKDAIHSEIAKSELLRRVCVEIKKSLNNCGDAIYFLGQKYPDEENFMRVNMLKDNVFELIAEVQDFANIESGRIALDEIPFNLIEEIKKVTDIFQPEVQRKGIELQAHVALSAIRDVVSDPQRFRQILIELLGNAVRVTEKGFIRISLETIELQGRKTLVRCSVEDTGMGMPREKLKKLFLIEQRAKEETESIGLGIIIARKLVNMMGGTLRASSPSPISTDPSTPGMQFSFSITCFSDQPFDKQLDYSSIVQYCQINVLIITSDTNQTQPLSNFLDRRGIQSDIFIYNRDSGELLINKLIIDKKRYQMVVISAESSELSFTIAEDIHREGLTETCLYLLVDTYSQKGNYVKAKSLNMDYYFVRRNDFTVYDEILKVHFPNLSDSEVSETAFVHKGLRILIAENNELNESVAKVIFDKMGYEVDHASNALFLMNHLNRKTYDIIFLDLKFPPTDGFQMTEALRMKYFKMPIIAMTSTLTKENLKRIADSGMDGFVAKPLIPEDILKIFEKHIRRQDSTAISKVVKNRKSKTKNQK